MGISWNDTAERDLLLSMLLHSQGQASLGSVKVAWESVVDTMKSFGYATATKDAISQRWQKRMLPQLRSDHPALFPGSPRKAAAAAGSTSKKTATPTKGRKRARDASKLEDDDELSFESPSKKSKQVDQTAMTDEAEEFA
ncbi:hypothetical protein F4818DRAFT_291504 [Hypoxylon cercidicola]|nr:hypothetical protein F4818DRAFT_291504 [Hypoxylon cercidicola]